MGLDLRMEVKGSVVTTAGYGRAVGRWGVTPFPQLFFRLFDGDADGQGDDAALYEFSIAATKALDFDLAGGTGETNLNGNAVGWDTLKFVAVVLDTPASGVKLWLGPQNRSGAAQMWFDGVTATYKQEVRDMLIQGDRNAGWAIGGGATKLCLTNPASSGDPVTGYLFVAGVQA